MDNTTNQSRGWRDALTRDNAVNEALRQEYFVVMEKFLSTAEKQGWEVGVDSAKGYIEMAEETTYKDRIKRQTFLNLDLS
jgi:hypothetical protein